MLVELAIGDAYGAGFEYADPAIVRAENNLSRYIRHQLHAIPPGAYTDDTQMSLAIAEALVSGEPWTPLNLANRFVEVFRRDPRPGYARHFYDFLRTVRDGKQLMAEIVPVSDKSGAAMRAAPLGVVADLAELLERAEIQAKITHDTPLGVDAAKAAALAAHYCVYDLGAASDVGRFVRQHVPGAWDRPWRGPVGSKGWMSVQAAITALAAGESLAEVLRISIAFTGDVDTVATIALGAAAASPRYARDLPAALYDGLEAGPYGQQYLRDLDQQLMSLKGPADELQS
ncbi:MAG TPA: ADP-ribosylglycohydrolase family protein [Herpetosiphonaceae bacterium]